MASYDIFISYRRKDSRGHTSGTDIARSIKQQLEIDGYRNRVFFDYSEITDGEFAQTILPAIEGCKVFLLILSREALQRCVNEDDWMRREILHAIRHNVKIVPVNPDYKFDGYPDGFPEELDIIRNIQHQCIHMDSSFEYDVLHMIENRIAPVTRPAGGARVLRLSRYFFIGLLLIAGLAFVFMKNLPEKGSQAAAVEVVEPSAEELCDKGMELMNEGKSDEAAAAFLAAAEKGNAVAQYNLGLCHENGSGVGQNYEEAVKWYMEAALQGNAEAQSSLAFCYSEGRGVEKDYVQAADWYLKAAEQGHATSQYNMGIFYSRGTGVSQDHAEAAKWYRRVAEQGYAAAQYILGVCYERGQGVAKNRDEAVSWYRKAAEQGYAKAAERLKRLGY